MSKVWWPAVFGLAILASSQSARAETLVTCGGSAGWSYFFEGPFLPKGQEGWREDAISQGGIALTRDGEELDILIRDVGGMISSRAEGAQVSLVQARDGVIMVLVNYPRGAIELYTFDLTRRQVVWSQHKFGVLIDKAHTMVGTC